MALAEVDHDLLAFCSLISYSKIHGTCKAGGRDRSFSKPGDSGILASFTGVQGHDEEGGPDRVGSDSRCRDGAGSVITPSIPLEPKLCRP
jgi:hypothetical protein